MQITGFDFSSLNYDALVGQEVAPAYNMGIRPVHDRFRFHRYLNQPETSTALEHLLNEATNTLLMTREV